ncbi:MAG: hypothetical protein JSS49_30370 [Planctomycetes bacterium]|nr:hypothetical protein [Planctomycetota bacterium]
MPNRSIKVVEFPELPEHGDVSDHFDAGSTVNELYEKVNQTEEWSIESVPPEAMPDKSKSSKKTDGAQFTDVANGRLFAELYSNEIRYCTDWRKFIPYDGRRWNRDNPGVAEGLAKNVADLRWSEAQKIGTQEARRFALRSASAPGINSMVQLAKSEPAIIIRSNQFDTDPMLFNCPNGTIDLRTGKLRKHRREDFITKLCPTPFDPKAKAPRWEEALGKIFDDDEDLIGFMQRFFGLCLTGLVTEQVIVIFVGTGSNGKSLILVTLLSLLGTDYAIKARDEILVHRGTHTHPTAMADLRGIRLAVVMETDAGDRFSEATLKAVTGGDPIRARRMYEDFSEFIPTHKFLLCTNHKPAVDATDHAFWRRILLLPFNVCFWKAGDPGNAGKKLSKRLKADPELGEKLAAEAEGILAWCVRGCLEWQKHGLGTTNAVTTATESYRREQDALSRFIEEVCEVSRSLRVASSSIYQKYERWCDANGERILPQNQFKEKLLEHSNEITFKRSNGSWFQGISLRKTK